MKAGLIAGFVGGLVIAFPITFVPYVALFVCGAIVGFIFWLGFHTLWPTAVTDQSTAGLYVLLGVPSLFFAAVAVTFREYGYIFTFPIIGTFFFYQGLTTFIHARWPVFYVPYGGTTCDNTCYYAFIGAFMGAAFGIILQLAWTGNVPRDIDAAAPWSFNTPKRFWGTKSGIGSTMAEPGAVTLSSIPLATVVDHTEVHVSDEPQQIVQVIPQHTPDRSNQPILIHDGGPSNNTLISYPTAPMALLPAIQQVDNLKSQDDLILRNNNLPLPPTTTFHTAPLNSADGAAVVSNSNSVTIPSPAQGNRFGTHHSVISGNSNGTPSYHTGEPVPISGYSYDYDDDPHQIGETEEEEEKHDNPHNNPHNISVISESLPAAIQYTQSVDSPPTRQHPNQHHTINNSFSTSIINPYTFTSSQLDNNSLLVSPGPIQSFQHIPLGSEIEEKNEVDAEHSNDDGHDGAVFLASYEDHDHSALPVDSTMNSSLNRLESQSILTPSFHHQFTTPRNYSHSSSVSSLSASSPTTASVLPPKPNKLKNIHEIDLHNNDSIEDEPGQTNRAQSSSPLQVYQPN